MVTIVNENIIMAVVCCEYPKNTCTQYGEEPKPPVIYVVMREPTSQELQQLQLRSRFNPELHYYVCKVHSSISDEGIVDYAKYTKLREPHFIEI